MQITNNIDEFQKLPEAKRREVYIPEGISTAYPVSECGEDLVEIVRAATKANVKVIIAPVSPENPKLYLRASVAERLLQAAKIVIEKTGGDATLKVTDAFRPLALQRKYFTEISRDIAAKEGLSGTALWEKVTQFIADPDKTPPHSTGGAVDLTIARISDGSEYQMGTSVDTVDEQANTWNPTVTGAAKKNRELLYGAMRKAGFVNLASEWWHYSHGDQYAAIYEGARTAKFGSIEKVPE